MWGTCHATCAEVAATGVARRAFITPDHESHADRHVAEHDAAGRARLGDAHAHLGDAVEAAEAESGYIRASWFHIYDIHYDAELVVRDGKWDADFRIGGRGQVHLPGLCPSR